MRKAPKNGYDNGVKADYRNRVWASFENAVSDIQRDETNTLKALIMPSAEGLEIETALDAGLQEQDIICVDRSAAVIATSKWRKIYPNIKFFASEIAEVGEKIARKGWKVRVANLDLCGNFSDDTIDAVRGFLQDAPWDRRVTFALTIAKGREGSALTTLLKSIGAQEKTGLNEPRMAVLFTLFGDDLQNLGLLSVLDQDCYTSGRNPMTWAVFNTSNSAVTDEELCQKMLHVRNFKHRGLHTGDILKRENLIDLANAEIDLGLTRYNGEFNRNIHRFPKSSKVWGEWRYRRQYFACAIAETQLELNGLCVLCSEQNHTYKDDDGNMICDNYHCHKCHRVVSHLGYCEKCEKEFLETNTNYPGDIKQWKDELGVWCVMTRDDPDQAPYIYRHLRGDRYSIVKRPSLGRETIWVSEHKQTLLDITGAE